MVFANKNPRQPILLARCRCIFMHCNESTTLRGDTATFVSLSQRNLLLTYENLISLYALSSLGKGLE